MTTLLERFEKKFLAEPMSGCWLWEGVLWDRRLGYGKFSIDGHIHRAHRVSWELYRGQIPDGVHVLHKCDNAYCVNPAHLYLGDQAQNNRDRDERGHHVALRGEENGMARLTDDGVRAIRRSTISSLQLEPFVCVSSSTIRRIRRRQTWSHVK